VRLNSTNKLPLYFIVLFLLTLFSLVFSQIPDTVSEDNSNKKQGVNSQDITVASLVKKYKDGYLISILPKTSEYDFKGVNMNLYYDFSPLKKYLDRISLESKNDSNGPYLPVDMPDYDLIEKIYDFKLTNELSVFGDWSGGVYRGNTKVKGEKFYIQYDIIGNNHVEDILVFVRGNEKLENIKPVWAKNYLENDTDYYQIPANDRIISYFPNKNNDLLSKIHKIVLNKFNKKTNEEKYNFSLINEVSEYEEKVYEIIIYPEIRKSYLVVVNGASLTQEIKFCLVFLITEDYNNIEEIIPLTILKTDLEYLECSFIVKYIYHSKNLDIDQIIARFDIGMGSYGLLIRGEKGIIEKIILYTLHGC